MAAAANEAAEPQTTSVTQRERFQIVRSGIAAVMGLPNEVKLQVFCELRDFGVDTGFGGCDPWSVSNKFLGILLLETNFGSIKVKIAWPKRPKAGAGAGGGAAQIGRLQDREVSEYTIRLKPVADGGAECVVKSGYGTGRFKDVFVKTKESELDTPTSFVRLHGNSRFEPADNGIEIMRLELRAKQRAAADAQPLWMQSIVSKPKVPSPMEKRLLPVSAGLRLIRSAKRPLRSQASPAPLRSLTDATRARRQRVAVRRGAEE